VHFKFSWKICNALLMMMMQRLNHRLRHVKLMNDSLCRILGRAAECCFNGVWPTSGLTLSRRAFTVEAGGFKRASRSRTPVLAPRPSSVVSCGVNMSLVLVVEIFLIVYSLRCLYLCASICERPRTAY
jgi:hypothetical protein